MPKASQVLATLKRDGWIEDRRHGSHRVLVKDSVSRTWAHHDGKDLGRVQLAQIANDFGYTLEQLRSL
jgi:predicted RNA binding protein YcfA (HicA-like mRNA interferase family)